MRYLNKFLLLICLPLMACVSADIELTINDDETYVAETEFRVAASVYSMMANMPAGEGAPETPCSDEEPVLDGEDYVCVETHSGTLDELISEAELAEGDDPFSSGTVERRGGNKLYVSVPLKSLAEDDISPEDIQMMSAMFGVSFDGRMLSLSVVGDKILETNGVISEDGTTASIEVAITELLQPTDETLETFDVLLRY